ncbi:MAG: YbaB/EbfC family nucleoid-associated protein [Ruminococcaceae bacterium]|nr:YbaB/EbfC family nucleoid-associated protein [Oscillospiraceae bacterium]
MKARLPDGMGKGPGNMQQMIREAQKMQEEMERTQEELDSREYEVSAGGGVCKIKISGTKEIKEISLDPMIVDPDDIETLQDIIVAGINEAIKLVETTNQEALNKITGGLKLY